MTQIAQYSSSYNVYLRIFRINVNTGLRQVFNNSTLIWEQFSDGSVADYGVAATLEGSTSNHVVDVPSEALVDGDINWYEWYIRASAAQSVSDIQITSYLAVYDPDRDTLLPPTMRVASYPANVPAQVKQVGDRYIEDTGDVGAMLVTNITGYTAPLPTGVILESSVYKFGSDDNDKLVRASATVDLTADFSFYFHGTVVGTGMLYIGLAKSAANIDDISATLIDPGETFSATKDQFYAGFILQVSLNSYYINTIGTVYTTNDVGEVIDPSSGYCLRWNAADQSLSLYSVDIYGSSREVLLHTIAAASLNLLLESSDASVSFCCAGLSDFLFVTAPYGVGTGYRGENTIPS